MYNCYTGSLRNVHVEFSLLTSGLTGKQNHKDTGNCNFRNFCLRKNTGVTTSITDTTCTSIWQ